MLLFNAYYSDAKLFDYLWCWPLFKLFTKNHGMLGYLLDGTTALIPAKFLVNQAHSNFVITESESAAHIYHIMLPAHELIQTRSGLWSESYFCGGYSTLPEAAQVYKAITGKDEMELAAPRLRKRDIAELLDLMFA